MIFAIVCFKQIALSETSNVVFCVPVAGHVDKASEGHCVAAGSQQAVTGGQDMLV
jgi:hypothetical protein